MDKILHDPKDPKLWELWYIPYYGSCRILSINRMDIVAVFRALSGIVLQKPTCRSYLLSSMILYVGFNEAGPKLEGAWDLQSCLLRNMAFSSSSPSLEGLRESHNFTHLSYPACRAEEPGLPMLFNVCLRPEPPKH